MPHARKLDNQTMPSQQPRFSKTVTDDEHKTTSTATGNTRGKIMLHPELDMDEMDFEVLSKSFKSGIGFLFLVLIFLILEYSIFFTLTLFLKILFKVKS